MQSQRTNLLRSLYVRQIHGNCLDGKTNANLSLSFTSPPQRLRFKLSSLLPDAHAAGRVFLGFTLDGNYLLAYTTDHDISADFEERILYKLEFWRFIPFDHLHLVSSVTIFDAGHTLRSEALIRVYQLPADTETIIVSGFEGWDNPSQYLHVSVIKVPAPSASRPWCLSCVNNKDSKYRCPLHNGCLHLSCLLPQHSSTPNVYLKTPGEMFITTSDSIVRVTYGLSLLVDAVIRHHENMCINDIRTRIYTGNLQKVTVQPEGDYSVIETCVKTASDGLSFETISSTVLSEQVSKQQRCLEVTLHAVEMEEITESVLSWLEENESWFCRDSYDLRDYHFNVIDVCEEMDTVIGESIVIFHHPEESSYKLRKCYIVLLWSMKMRLAEIVSCTTMSDFPSTLGKDSQQQLAVGYSEFSKQLIKSWSLSRHGKDVHKLTNIPALKRQSLPYLIGPNQSFAIVL